MNRRQRKKLKKKQMERLMMVDVEKVIALLRDPDTMKVLEQALQKTVEAVQKITNTMLRVLEEKRSVILSTPSIPSTDSSSEEICSDTSTID